MSALKVIRFVEGREPDAPLAAVLRDRWAAALQAGGDGEPAGGRPARVAVMAPLTLRALEPPLFAAVDIQWFPDTDTAARNDTWLRSVDGDLCAGSGLVGSGSWMLVAEESVLRGEDWLKARWAAGGMRYKMMSFGRRNPRLTPAEFSARWRSHAGSLGGEAIPDEVRGLAYVQNHPVAPDDGRSWPLDAVNEVWFERLDHLRRRGGWFAARQAAALRTEAESFMSPTETWSMFVREEPVPDGVGGSSGAAQRRR